MRAERLGPFPRPPAGPQHCASAGRAGTVEPAPCHTRALLPARVLTRPSRPARCWYQKGANVCISASIGIRPAPVASIIAPGSTCTDRSPFAML